MQLPTSGQWFQISMPHLHWVIRGTLGNKSSTAPGSWAGDSGGASPTTCTLSLGFFHHAHQLPLFEQLGIPSFNAPSHLSDSGLYREISQISPSFKFLILKRSSRQLSSQVPRIRASMPPVSGVTRSHRSQCRE